MTKEERKSAEKKGKIFFWTVVGCVLVYFWWLVIYSHGVAPHHG